MANVKPFVRTICIDFDGVLHSYTSTWAGEHIVADPPVDGAIEWLRALLADEGFQPCIYSSRSRSTPGVNAMKNWLLENGLTYSELLQLEFATEKPAAWLTVDDRAICFTGMFPSLKDMATFKPWNRA